MPPAPACAKRWTLVRPSCSPSTGPFITFGASGLQITRKASVADAPIELVLTDPPAGDFVAQMVVSSAPDADLGLTLVATGLEPDPADPVPPYPFLVGIESYRESGSWREEGVVMGTGAVLGVFSTSATRALPHSMKLSRVGGTYRATLTGGNSTIGSSLSAPKVALYPRGSKKTAFTSARVASISITANGTTWTDSFACNSTAP